MLNKTTAEEAVESDRSIYKIIALTVLGIISSFISGYFLKLFIFDSQFDFLLFYFLAFLSFLAFFLLKTFFIKGGSKISLIVFLESLGLLAGTLSAPFVAFSAAAFYGQLSRNIVIGIFVSFLLLLWANFSGRSELENSLKIRFWLVGKKVLPKAIAALALFASVAYVSVGSANGKEFFISQPTFEKIIFPVAELKFIQNFLPGIDLSLPAGELIKNIAKSQLEQNSQTQLLSESGKKQLINQAAQELEKQFSGFLGAPINPKNKISETLYDAMTKKILGLPESSKPFIPVGAALLIFLTIVSLSLPIRWLVTVLTYVIYEICLAVGFSVIMLEGRSREIIILK